MMPDALTLTFIGIGGLVLGSFANVLVLRDHRLASVLTGRSECPRCGRGLRWYELVPVLSWVAQGGRCRGCRCRVSAQYPLVELLSAGLAVFAAANFPFPAALPAFVCLYLLLVIAAIDVRTQAVRLEYCAAAGLCGLAASVLAGGGALGALRGAAFGGLFIFAVIAAWKAIRKEDGMGDGDIWIAAACGALAGWPSVLVLLFGGVMLGAAVGVTALATARGQLKTALPFGPFLALGTLAAVAWGPNIVAWYTMGL